MNQKDPDDMVDESTNPSNGWRQPDSDVEPEVPDIPDGHHYSPTDTCRIKRKARDVMNHDPSKVNVTHALGVEHVSNLEELERITK